MPPDRATDHYVGRGVEQVIQAPYVAYNVRMLGCILPACPADLNETLTRHLNVTADGSLEFSTTIPYVLFYYAEVPYIGSATNSDKPLGGSPEREAAFVIFAQEKKSDKLYAYFPYMFVTVGSAMAAGREVYGFPKQLAKISAGTHGRLPAPRLTFWDRIRLWFARLTAGTAKIDVHPPERDRVRVGRETRVLHTVPPEWLDSNETPTETLIEVEFPASLRWKELSGQSRNLGWSWTAFAHVRNALFNLIARPDISSTNILEPKQADALIQLANGGAISMVFLKQFRDATDPLQACYKALIEADASATRFHGGRQLIGKEQPGGPDGADLDPFRFTTMHPTIVKDLGLDAEPPTADRPLTPVNSFYLEFDFDIGAGTTLWRKV